MDSTIRKEFTFGDRSEISFTAKRNWLQRWELRFYLPSLALPTDHTDRNTTSSIQNWIEKLEEHNRLIVMPSPTRREP